MIRADMRHTLTDIDHLKLYRFLRFPVAKIAN